MLAYKNFFRLFFALVLLVSVSFGQPLNRQEFFEQDSIAALHLSADLKNIDLEKQKEVKRPGIAKLTLSDGRVFTGPIELHGRGKIRFEYCDPPPLMLYFKTKEPSSLRGLGKLKLVWGCRGGDYYDQLVLKEYLIYKIYNLLTPYSFRVRLLDLQVDDSARSGGLIKRKGFLLEDIDELAKRNGCREYEDTSLMPIDTDQHQYALVTVFQYMIGNTDWSISNYQNIKMVVPREATRMIPLVVPYDFDNSGLVNAEYAAPHESLPIESVRQRYNKGMSLNQGDIHAVRALLLEKKDAIAGVIEHCTDLKSSHKRDMIQFLNVFFRELEDVKTFNNIFLKEPK